MPSVDQVLVSTLTPVFNEAGHVRAAVAGLQAQDVAHEAEFLFVDGRSTDATRAILEELAAADPRIRVLDNPARHTASALNIALRAARGRYVARIDGHSRYPPGYISRGIARLRQGDVDWVAGPQVPVGADAWSCRVALALGTPLATGRSKRWESDVAELEDGEVTLSTGVFDGVWLRATLDRHGGWDEGWPINQDSELAARVLRGGGRIVSLPEMGAEYVPRSSLRGLARQYRRYGMYRAKTALRHPWTIRPPHLAMPGVVLASAGALLAPAPWRRVARGAVALYAGGMLVQTARIATVAGGDGLALPAVLVTMHASWGAGFLLGLVRFAPPARRRPALATDLFERARRE
jgi:succinoglycan biosynthesis protein ExoA